MYNRCRRNCCCRNTDCMNCSNNIEAILNTSDQPVYNDDDSCECGFNKEDSMFPENAMLGQSYVPTQKMDKTFIPCVGLKNGTIFPELVNPYSPCQSMEEIAFIKAMNTIGKGCNKC